MPPGLQPASQYRHPTFLRSAVGAVRCLIVAVALMHPSASNAEPVNRVSYVWKGDIAEAGLDETQVRIDVETTDDVRRRWGKCRETPWRKSPQLSACLRGILVTDGGLDGQTARDLIKRLHSEPELRVNGARAELLLRSHTWSGPFLRTPDDRVQVGPLQVPDNTRLSIGASAQTAVLAAAPFPDRQPSDHEVYWDSIDSPTPEIWFQTARESEASDWRAARESWAVAIAAIPFVVVLIAVGLRGPPRSERRFAAGMVFLAAGAAGYMAISWLSPELWPLGKDREVARRLWIAVCLGAAMCSCGRSVGRLRLGLWIAALSALVVATSGALLWWRSTWAAASGATVAAVILWWVPAWGFLRWTEREDKRWDADSDALLVRRTWARRLAVASALIALTAEGQLLYSSLSSIESVRRLEMDQSGPEIWLQQLAEVPTNLSLLGLSVALIPLMAFGLRAARQIRAPGSPTIVAAAVAGGFVGAGGALGPVRAPLAMVLVIAFLTLLLRRLASTSDVSEPADDAEVLLRLAIRAGRLRQPHHPARHETQLTTAQVTESLAALERDVAQLDPPVTLDRLGVAALASTARTKPAVLRTLRRWIVVPGLPALYAFVTSLQNSLPGAASADQPAGLIWAVALAAVGAVSWFFIAALFLTLYADLPGRNGVTRAGVATLAYLIPAGLAAMVLGPEGSGMNVWFTAAVAFLVLAGLGGAVDFDRIEACGGTVSDLGHLYRWAEVRAFVVLGVPAAIAVFTVLQGLQRGEGADGIGSLLETLPSIVP